MMEFIINIAEGFMGLFQEGANVFIGWMGSIVPLVLILMTAMNALVNILGEERVTKLARVSAKNPLTRYLILPFVSTFMLGNPMSITIGRFLPEFYKPGWAAAVMQANHTSNGIFPHINPGELFVWLGIAQGVQSLGLNITELAIRYLLVGLVMNFVSGWSTDFITERVAKQQGVTLSKVFGDSDDLEAVTE